MSKITIEDVTNYAKESKMSLEQVAQEMIFKRPENTSINEYANIEVLKLAKVYGIQ